MKTKSILILLICALHCIGISAWHTVHESPSEAERLKVIHLKDNHFSCSFDGVKHDFILDLPEKTEGAPLVLLLPGYGNTADSFRSTVHFEQQANPLGYAAVWVTGAKAPNAPGSSIGWNSGLSAEGNDDTAFLTALAKYLQKEYGFDTERTYAAGFSNGAFMVHRLAMEAADTFSACVSVAGLMPLKIWDARNTKNSVSFFQITGEKDDAIPKKSDGSANYAKNPAIEDVMSYWAASNDLSLCETKEIGKGSRLSMCKSTSSPKRVWHLTVRNGRHSWPDEKLNGFNTNQLILEFFENDK